MCGIIGCVSSGSAGSTVLAGLRQLEYRGYDSAGLAVAMTGGPRVCRAVGPIAALHDRVHADGWLDDTTDRVAIGHTRWATHGAVTESNAHPFLDCTGQITVAHNGVLDNSADLRAELELAGHVFRSDVDSEVLAHLIEAAFDTGVDPLDAVSKALAQVQGSWAVAVVISNGLVAARNGSPLLVRGGPGGLILASDAAATSPFTGPIRVLADGDIVWLGGGSDADGKPEPWRWRSADGSSLLPTPIDVDAVDAISHAAALTRAAGSDGDRMGMEIGQQADVIDGLLTSLLPAVLSGVQRRTWGFKRVDRVRFLACGTSFHAADIAARTLEAVAGVRAQVVVASEFSGQGEVADLTVAISQSGETADLLSALTRTTGPVLAITNVTWSSLARRADIVIDCGAGFEQGVAATKSFSAQVVAGVCLALALVPKHAHSDATAGRLAAGLAALPARMALLDARCRERIDEVVSPFVDAPGWLFLGTGVGLPYAAEGALKLKELTYRWAQAYPVGELKHGPLALVQDGTPVVIVDSGDVQRLAACAAEVQARGGRVLWVDDIGLPRSAARPRHGDPMPWGPLAAGVTLQHLARAVARQLGRDVDRPRNLAKSVTVA